MHRYLQRSLVLAVSALLLVTAACSSSSDSGGSSGGPLKIGIITNVGGAVDFAEALAAAKGAVRAVNAAGGVHGRKLELEFCNEGLDPNKGRACAMQMINAHVVATTGNTIYTAEKDADALLARAGIAQIGNWASGVSEKDSNSYLFFGGQTYSNAAQIYAATKWGGKRIGVVRLDYPYTAPFPDFYRKACQQLGCQVVSTAVIPSNSVTDLSPYAAQLMQGKPDVIVPDLGALIQPLLKAMDQIGYTGKMSMQDSNITTQAFLSQSPAVQAQYLLSTAFPPPSAAAQFPGIKQFLADMQAEKASGDTAAPTQTMYSSTPTMDAYIAVKVFAQIANSSGATDAKSFKTAIDAAKNVDLFGLTKDWTPNEKLFSSLPRASLDSWYFYTITGGKQSLLNQSSIGVNDIVKSAY